MRRQTLLAFPLVAALAACESPPDPISPEEHNAQVEAWRARRYESLRQPVGWLSLVGLFWIEDSTITFGASSENDFAYASPGPGFPARAGTFQLRGDSVTFVADAGARVTRDGAPVESILLAPDTASPMLQSGSVRWTVIRRSGRAAIRAWDEQSPVLTTFAGIDTWPVDLRWRFPARFIVKDPPDTLEIPNVLGGANRTPSPASVAFEIAGEEYQLALWKDSDDPANFFTAFGDRTNGPMSYGGGRYLWVDAPDEHGRTLVDFNRAYNPPCVFTEFATCPLPPRANRIPIPIEAGEKVWAMK
ncbi:MAG: DUF1684 domain-containing protein [Longimicrobiales bacterium]